MCVCLRVKDSTRHPVSHTAILLAGECSCGPRHPFLRRFFFIYFASKSNLCLSFIVRSSLIVTSNTMGANMSKALAKLFGSKEMRILMLGLDAAGKTSKMMNPLLSSCPPNAHVSNCYTVAILYKLKLNQSVTTIPTVGFNVESVTYKNVKFNVWVCVLVFLKDNIARDINAHTFVHLYIYIYSRTWEVRIRFETFGVITTQAPKVLSLSSTRRTVIA